MARPRGKKTILDRVIDNPVAKCIGYTIAGCIIIPLLPFWLISLNRKTNRRRHAGWYPPADPEVVKQAERFRAGSAKREKAKKERGPERHAPPWYEYLFDEEVPQLDLQTRPVDEQRQSLLFQRLPVEIRKEIWRYALGENVFWLRYRGGKLRHTTPTREQLMDFPWHKTDPSPAFGDQLSLLLTSRAIYAEAAEYLYSANTFATMEIHTLIALRRTVPTVNFKRIRSLHLAFDLDLPYFPGPHAYDPWGSEHSSFDFNAWTSIWRLVASIKQLKHLRVQFWDQIEYKSASTWVGYLEALDVVVGVQDFELKVPWIDDVFAAKPELMAEGATPYRIVSEFSEEVLEEGWHMTYGTGNDYSIEDRMTAVD